MCQLVVVFVRTVGAFFNQAYFWCLQSRFVNVHIRPWGIISLSFSLQPSQHYSWGMTKCCGIVLSCLRFSVGMSLALAAVSLVRIVCHLINFISHLHLSICYLFEQGYFFATMIIPFLYPELLSIDDKETFDQFSYYEIITDGAMIGALGFTCGAASSKCFGYGWSWRLAIGMFLVGFDIPICERAMRMSLEVHELWLLDLLFSLQFLRNNHHTTPTNSTILTNRTVLATAFL